MTAAQALTHPWLGDKYKATGEELSQMVRSLAGLNRSLQEEEAKAMKEESSDSLSLFTGMIPIAEEMTATGATISQQAMVLRSPVAQNLSTAPVSSNIEHMQLAPLLHLQR